MCYLRLDQKAKAQTALERVVGDFADQAELVSRARETLAGLLPAPDFPEVEGCRLVETMHLELSETPVPEDARQHIDLYEGGLLEIAWTTSPALEKKLQDPGGYFVVAVCPKALWDPNGMDLKRCSWLELVPGSARSTRYGQSWPEEESPVEQPATPLQAGEYLVAVSANKTREGVAVRRGRVWDTITKRCSRSRCCPCRIRRSRLDDVQPDGTIRFENILQAVNGSDESIREDQFCNSDFVHVTEMFDADGRPLSFTTKHRDRNFHYRVTLNTPVPPGEPLLFGSRGTQTGLVKPVPGAKDEFRYRMTHWPSSNKTTRRVEIHRLPDGAELLETVPADMDPAHARRSGGTSRSRSSSSPGGPFTRNTGTAWPAGRFRRHSISDRRRGSTANGCSWRLKARRGHGIGHHYLHGAEARGGRACPLGDWTRSRW